MSRSFFEEEAFLLDQVQEEILALVELIDRANAALVERVGVFDAAEDYKADGAFGWPKRCSAPRMRNRRLRPPGVRCHAHVRHEAPSTVRDERTRPPAGCRSSLPKVGAA